MGQRARDMVSVVLTNERHAIYTQAWKQAIPYGTKYILLEREEVRAVARLIYAEVPQFLHALGL